MAFKEVVVSLLDRAQPLKSLWPFALYLSFLVTLLVTGIALTPMSDVWFQWINGLPGDMSEVGRIGLLVSIFIPGLVVMINFYQGIIVWGERTRGVIEAVSLFLLTLSVGLGAGIFWNSITGLYVAMVAFTLGSICRLIWLWYRGQPVIEQIRHREASTTT